MKNIIENQIRQLLIKKGGLNPETRIDISIPPKEMKCDFAVPCFRFSLSAWDIATKISDITPRSTEKIGENIVYKNIASVGKIFASESEFFLLKNALLTVDNDKFLNFHLNIGVLAEFILSEISNKQENFAANTIGEGKSVMIEYPSNNTHKEFHVGHLRNVCIGNTLVQLYRKSGYNVTPVNYLNDFGSHVAKCLWGVIKLHNGVIPEGNRQKWLGEVYAEASTAVKENDDAKKEVSEIQQKLEAKDPEIWSLFEQTRNWSIEKFLELFSELRVEHTTTFYESDIKASGQKIVDELLEKGIATVGERGAIIIDLTAYNLDIALLRKADGTGLYLTSDIPLAEKKFTSYDVDESIVITGLEQNFYFKQLYKILEILGFKKKLTHISYGLITLPEGKMSSRSGNVILYEDLRDSIFEKMYAETAPRHSDWSEEKIKDTVTKLTQAALKFTIQKHEAAKNIVFDMQEATSFEGFSGPYILYVVARINSLIKKAKDSNVQIIDWFLLKELEEKKLLLLMAQYEETIQKAIENYNPSVIAKYSFDLAQAFNEFYNKQSILTAENEALGVARLELSKAVQSVLKNALSLLTIDTVDEM